MKAALTTDGITTMQRALFSRSCGILSGTFKISSITVPAFSIRFSSFSLSLPGAANAVGTINAAGTIKSSAAARYFETFILNSSLGFSSKQWACSKTVYASFAISRDQDNPADQRDGAQNWGQRDGFVFIRRCVNRAN